MNVMDLDLAEPAKSVALEVFAKFPWAVFTSGRRNVADQARAMTQNIMKDKHFIVDTYRPSAPMRACQMWLDQHAGSTYEATLAGLTFVLNALPYEQLAQLSLHFLGLAFDILPDLTILGEPTERGATLIAFLQERAAACGGKFLGHEGKAKRWHGEFPTLPKPLT